MCQVCFINSSSIPSENAKDIQNMSLQVMQDTCSVSLKRVLKPCNDSCITFSVDDEDLAILSRAFAVSKRTKQQPGYCLNIW